MFGFGPLDWDLVLWIFGFRALAWEFCLGIFGLGSCLGKCGPEAGGAVWHEPGEPEGAAVIACSLRLYQRYDK